MPRHDTSIHPAPDWRAPRHALLAVLLLAACGARDAGDTQAEAGTVAGQPAAAGSAAGSDDGAPSTPGQGSEGEVQVTIGSGPFAGTHKAAGDMGCFAQPGVWGANHENQRERGLTGMLLLLHGTPASGGNTKQFNFNLVFGQSDGPLGTNGVLGINTAEGSGSGTVTVERDGKRATIRIEGTTSYGAKLTGVVRCATVDVVD